MGSTRPTSVHAQTPLLELATGPVATIVMATAAAPRLGSNDRRRLAAQVTNLEENLRRASTPTHVEARTIRRLWSLADKAGTSRAGHGVALVASSNSGRQVTLDHPVSTKSFVGEVLSYEQLVEATWGIGSISVLYVTPRGARLIVSDHGSVWEPHPPWDPIEGCPLAGPLREAVILAEGIAQMKTPLVLAGDEQLVERLCGLDAIGGAVAGIVPGDHAEASAEALVALAQQVLRRRLDRGQRAAMTQVALAADHGRALCGGSADAHRSATTNDLLITELSPLSRARRDSATAIDERVRAAGGTVVVVPDGFLACFDRIVLVPGAEAPHAATPSPSLGSSVRTEDVLTEA